MSSNHRHIEAVIFDLDDTLISWAEPALGWDEFTRPKSDNIYHFLSEAGYQLPAADDFHATIGQAIRDTWSEAKKTWTIPSMGEVLFQVFADLGLDCSQLNVEEVLRVYDWGPVPGVVPYEDAIPVLAELRRRGYKLGLLTNSILPMWMRDAELHALQLMEYLDARVASGDVGYLKPHPAVYLRILEMLETTPERAVFVGDRPSNDIAGANEVGLVSVLMDPPHLDRQLEGVKPDYTIGCLNELLPILERLEGQN